MGRVGEVRAVGYERDVWKGTKTLTNWELTNKGGMKRRRQCGGRACGKKIKLIEQLNDYHLLQTTAVQPFSTATLNIQEMSHSLNEHSIICAF